MRNNWKDWPTEKISTRLLYYMTGVTAVVYLLFGLVGYDRPFEDNPNFNAPLFTDAVLGLMFLMILGAIGVSLWTVWRTLKNRGKGEQTVNNIPVKKIGYSITLGSAALLLLTFLFGSSEAMEINGVTYADAFWLRTADMLINTILIMIIAAAGAVLLGATNYYRRK